MMMTDPTSANGNLQAAGGYGPPGGGGYPPPGGGGYGGPPGGGGYGGPPGGGPPGYGGPPQGGPPGGGFGGGPGGFGPPGGFPGPGGPMMPGAGGEVNTTLPLILNIVALVFCSTSCIAPIIAIVGIVFSVQAGNMKKMGDVGGATAKAKSAMTMAIVALAIGFVLDVIFGILRAMNS